MVYFSVEKVELQSLQIRFIKGKQLYINNLIDQYTFIYYISYIISLIQNGNLRARGERYFDSFHLYLDIILYII